MAISLLPSTALTSAISDPLFDAMQVKVYMARLDQVHDVVSGNKIFKLWYFLEEAKNAGLKKIVTFGGTWSNHLVATAYAAKHFGLSSKGIVRGEKPVQLSETLKDCLQYGMELEFVSRTEYRQKCLTEGIIQNEFYIPEGGYSLTGAKGAALIAGILPEAEIYCIAAGTATTLAGLCIGFSEQNILCVPAIKNMNDIQERLEHLVPGNSNTIIIDNRFHFGGFAKFDEQLLNFMNDFYTKQEIRLDIIYTGKLMFTVYEKISAGEFPIGSTICCIHTGGLQGNRGVGGKLKY